MVRVCELLSDARAELTTYTKAGGERLVIHIVSCEDLNVITRIRPCDPNLTGLACPCRGL